MQETARLILGFRAAGRSEKIINDFLRFIGSVSEQFKPSAEEFDKTQDMQQ